MTLRLLLIVEHGPLAARIFFTGLGGWDSGSAERHSFKYTMRREQIKRNMHGGAH
jgi:hypothetical protein